MMREGTYERQKEFNKNFLPEKMTHEDRVRFTKEYILHLMSECEEVLNVLDWKLHRPGAKRFIRSNLLEEVVDVFKYWLSIAIVWDIRPHEINNEFLRKTEVVEQRYQQEKALAETTQKIAIIDIDGVLADYPASFVQYVNDRTGGSSDVDGIYENLVEGLSRIDVVRWKQRYREEGFEGEHITPTAYARDFMYELKCRGYFLCVVTARPYGRFKRMFGDTLRWFMNNHIDYDAIVFHEDKQTFALDLIDSGKEIVFAVEDHPGQARSLATLGIRVYLLTRPYNKDAEFGDLPVIRINELEEAFDAKPVQTES